MGCFLKIQHTDASPCDVFQVTSCISEICSTNLEVNCVGLKQLIIASVKFTTALDEDSVRISTHASNLLVGFLEGCQKIYAIVLDDG